MPQVAIVGAGPLGGELAFVLARRGVAEAIVLVDENGRVAEGKALDIMQSAPIASFAARVSGSADLFVATGASIVVIADRTVGGEWQGDEGLRLLRRYCGPGRSSVVICAGASQRELVGRAVRELNADRTRILGTAPEGLAAGVRAVTALEADRSAKDVSLALLGVPPARVVIPWDDATIGGIAAARLLDETARRRVAARAAHLWPPGPFTLAAAAAKAVAAVCGASHESVCAFVAPDDALGLKARTGAATVVLGPGGIERVERPTLSVHDQVALDNALLL